MPCGRPPSQPTARHRLDRLVEFAHPVGHNAGTMSGAASQVKNNPPRASKRAEGEVVATVTFIYDHHSHDVTNKLITLQHDSNLLC